MSVPNNPKRREDLAQVASKRFCAMSSSESRARTDPYQILFGFSAEDKELCAGLLARLADGERQRLKLIERVQQSEEEAKIFRYELFKVTQVNAELLQEVEQTKLRGGIVARSVTEVDCCSSKLQDCLEEQKRLEDSLTVVQVDLEEANQALRREREAREFLEVECRSVLNRIATDLVSLTHRIVTDMRKSCSNAGRSVCGSAGGGKFTGASQHSVHDG